MPGRDDSQSKIQAKHFTLETVKYGSPFSGRLVQANTYKRFVLDNMGLQSKVFQNCRKKKKKILRLQELSLCPNQCQNQIYALGLTLTQP